MRRFHRASVGILLLSAATWIGSAGQSASPYDSRPNDPYTVSATVTAGQNKTFTVRVKVVEKKTGQVVSSPAVTLQSGLAAEVFSDRVAGKPEFHTRIFLDQAGKANVTFEAYDHILQRSAVSVSPTE